MSQETIEARIIRCDSCCEEFEMNNRTAVFQEDDSFAEESAIYQGWVVSEDGDHFCPKCAKEMIASGDMIPNPELEGLETEKGYRPLSLSALDLIDAEREKQIGKGYDVENDIARYDKGDLLYIANELTLGVDPDCPEGWNEQYWKTLYALPYIDRVRIAATWYAKELEILLHFENKEREVPNA